MYVQKVENTKKYFDCKCYYLKFKLKFSKLFNATFTSLQHVNFII